MTSSNSASDSNPSKVSIEKIAQSLVSMSDAQLQQLFSILLKMRSQQDERQFNSTKKGLFHRMLSALSLLSERDFWKSSLAATFPWVVALIAAPFVIPFTFERDRDAAEPKISIEYAFLSRHSQQLPQFVTELVRQISQNPIYQAYTKASLLRGKITDISSFGVAGARLGTVLRQQFLTKITDFQKYLLELKQEIVAQQIKLPTLTKEELKDFAFTVLDDPSTLNNSAPRKFLSNSLKEKILRASTLLVDVDKIEKAVMSSIPEVRLRLILLNRGATDGLVRHHGKLEYRDKKYVILRTSPPSEDFNAFAVPVYQTNKYADDYAPGSVGKIEKDSMAEFWYSFKLPSGSEKNMDSLCREGEKITVVLLDHNSHEVTKKVDCNG